MNIDSDIEYKKYLETKTEAELNQIANSIDRSRLKHRYNMVMAQLEVLAESPIPVNDEFVINKVSRGWFARILLTLFTFIVGSYGFGILFGILWLRGASNEPWTIWERFVPILFLIFVVLGVYAIFSSYSVIVSSILACIGALFTLPLFIFYQSFSHLLTGLIPFFALCIVMFWPDLKKVVPKIFGVTILKSEE